MGQTFSKYQGNHKSCSKKLECTQIDTKPQWDTITLSRKRRAKEEAWSNFESSQQKNSDCMQLKKAKNLTRQPKNAKSSTKIK